MRVAALAVVAFIAATLFQIGVASGFGGVEVIITYYHPVVWQTDSDPSTASCGPIDEAPLMLGDKIVALSRDLFFDKNGSKRCGERVAVITEHGIIWGIVWDTMNSRFIRRVDVMYRPGFRPKWGITRGRLFSLGELGG